MCWKTRLQVQKDEDDLASYLTRFDRIAELLKVNKDSHGVRLGDLFSGKATKIYT